MTPSVYAQWLARGRAHQKEQRPVDAMLCYRRAVRVDASQSDAHLHLGEVLWQLGKLPEAIVEWREAVRAHGASLPAHLALAEGMLATGEFDHAAQAADTALAHFAGIAPLLFVRGASRIALATRGDEELAESALQDVSDALQRHRDLLKVPSLAGPLAGALTRGAVDVPITLVDVIAGLMLDYPDILRESPAELVAVTAERLAHTHDARVNALLERVAARAFGAGDHDALRRLALIAVHCRHAEAQAFARQHARVCSEAFGSSLPLMWPRRASGALRVVVLANAGAGNAGISLVAQAIPRSTRERCEFTLVLVGDSDPSQTTRLAESLDARVLALPGVLDGSQAGQLALLDADLLVDVCGMNAAVGPLLAARPARTAATLTSLDARIAEPLVDVTWTPEALAREVAQRAAAVIDADSGMPTPIELAAMLADAARLHQKGDTAAARGQYDRVLALQPAHARVLHLRGALRRDAGDLDGALEDFSAAMKAAPRYLDSRIAAAQAALDLGRPQLAIDIARGHLADATGYKALWVVLALAHLAHGEAAVAAEVLEHATHLDLTDGETHYNHGVALQTLRRFDDAARAYQRALAFRPDLSAADFNLGVLFQEQGQNDAAIAAYSQVLRDNAAHVMAYKNLGEVLFAAGRLDAWRANFARFEANCPHALALAVQALEVCQHFGEFERLEHYLDGLRNERYTTESPTELVQCLEELLYLLLFFDVEPDIVHRFSQTYDATAKVVYGEAMPRAVERREGRLRVGYLSADLRNHVMGKMIWEALHRHDRTAFELFFYSLSTIEDSWSARFRELADHYSVVAPLPEKEAAAMIARDDLDILVDLSTHTRGAKPGILALKPARVQITHVASAGAVGLSAIDFKLTDRYADVPANQEHMIERLLPMQGCVYPYRHIAPSASAVYDRARLGMAPDDFVIGAFVTPLKLSRRCLRLWREVLERIPRARLAISPNNAALQSSFLRIAASAGIPAQRLVLVPQGRDEHENQARYALVDAVLDPMPFGGVNGTLEALDMGVPVVTLCGGRHGERTSYSILANLGVTDTVATNGPDYVEIAVRLASDPAFMRSVRERIRAGIAHSALTDMAAHTRHLEAAYRAALEHRTSTTVAAETA